MNVAFAPADAGGAFPRLNEPVTFGVLLPKGAHRVTDALRLVDGAARPMPSQLQALDRWGDGSIRWLLVDTRVCTDERGAARGWRLEAGDSAGAPRGSLRVQAERDGLLVDTGVARFALQPGEGSPLTSVLVDGQPAIDERASRFHFVAADGRAVPIVFHEVAAGTNGPWRGDAFARGTVASAAHKLPIRVDVRFEFFAASAIVRAHVALTNPNRARHDGGFWDLGDPGSLMFRELRFDLALPSSARYASARCSVAPDEPHRLVATPYHVRQESSGGERWTSPVHRNRDGVVPMRARGYVEASVDGISRGPRATPVVSVRRGADVLAATLRDFWQNFPKSIAVDDARVSIGIFPAVAEPHELQGGERKTTTATLAFGQDTITPDPLDWCRAPLVATARHDALAQPPIGTRWTQECYDALVDAGIDGDHRFEAKNERVDEYGWRNFGDLYGDHEAVGHPGPTPLISHYNNQYDTIAGFAHRFLESGDARWWQLCDRLARHVVDIDVYHCEGDKAAYNGGLFWHTNHYVDAHTATHRTYSRRAARDSGGPSCEHNYTTGLMLHYFLTGSPDSRDAVVGLADWVIAMDDGRRTPLRWIDAGPTGLASATYSADFHGPGRGAGNSINALVDAHRLTGDGRYLRMADALVARCIHPEDDLAALGLDQTEARWSYTVFLQVLGKYLEHRAERGIVDFKYRYARASLLHYARWMAAHEAPYLSRPERLQFPTETWAAQDIRKAAVFEFAAQHAAAGEERERFAERARFFLEYSVSTLQRMPTRALTRPLALLMAYGFQRPTLPAAALPAVDSSPVDFGRPARFVNQKRRVRGRLAGAAAALFGVAAWQVARAALW